MRRLLVVLLVAVGLVPIAGGTAWACSCSGTDNEAQRYRWIKQYSTAVYGGTVLERIDPAPPAPGAPPAPPGDVRYRIRVDRTLKGAAMGSQRTVSTSGSGGTCGIELSHGRVFVAERQGRVGLCDGTTQADVDGEVARFLRYNRTLPDTGSPPVGAMAAVAALVLVAGVTSLAAGSGVIRSRV